MTSWLDTTYVQRYGCLRDARPSATLTLGEALDAIVEGTYAPQIEELRHIREVCAPETYRQAKQRLPALTFAGTFEPTRARAHIHRHSGIVHADVDHLEDKAALTALKLRLMQDGSTVYCFCSPSGAGLKYGARVAPVDTNDAYRHAWQTVCDAHQAQYDIIWDPSGKDICRLCFVSDDPTCFVNPDADVFPVPAPPPPPPAPRVVMHIPYTRPYVERQAERVLRQAEHLILTSAPGQQHFARCKAAYLLGGYVAGGLLPYSDAYRVLEAAVSQTARDIPRAMRTIEDGLQAGAARPITPEQTRPIPQMTTINAKEVPPWHA